MNKPIVNRLFIGMLMLTAIIFLGADAAAGEISRIELNDGSVITGEVISFDGRVWTIRTGSMGTLKIDGAKVVSIRSKTAGSRIPPAAGSGEKTVNSADIQAMQQSIMANEQIMTMIMNLQNDPEIQDILRDPEIMKAVSAGDMNALMANPKFIKLMENARIKAITREAVKE